MNRILLVMALAWVAVTGKVLAADTNADAIIGIWHTEGDETRIRIFKSGDEYFGQIVWLKEPKFPASLGPELGGKSKFDGKNPDPKLKNRPIIGLEMMSHFVYEGKNRWVKGRIYDPESGNTYRSKLTLDSNHKLEVRGYIGISLLGRTVVWTR